MRFARWTGTFLPQRLRLNLVWSYMYNETDADGYATYSIKGNGMNEPLAGNNEAVGCTALANLYNRYRVLASSILIECINNDADDAVYVVCYPAKATGAIGQANVQAAHGISGAKNVTVSNQTGRGILMHYARTADVLNIPMAADVNLNSDLTGNPTTLWYWVVYIHNLDGAALACEVRFKVVFDVILYDQNADAQGV